MDKVIIRKATLADKEDVIKIHDHVYDGHDYLPAYYDHFLSSSVFTPYVLLYDEKIIMFEVVQVVDDGQTQVGRAGRINPEYERRGFLKHFSASLDEWRRQKDIKTIASIITDANPAMERATFQRRFRHLITKHMPIYYVDIEKIDIPAAEIQEINHLDRVSDEILSQYFKSPDVKQYLSREGRMIVDMVPLKMIESNIVYMRGPKGYTDAFTDIRVDKNGLCSGVLTFGTTFQVQRSRFQCNLDVFGTDTDSLKRHIARHLIAMKEKVRGTVGVLVMVQEDFNLDKLDLVFEELGVQRTIWYNSRNPTLRYSKICLYERIVHASKY